jgi:hypothetical protein
MVSRFTRWPIPARDYLAWAVVSEGEVRAPQDEPTLAALDQWMTRRGPQRALPHPRLNRPADFLFTERGRRLTAFRLLRSTRCSCVST